MKLLEGKTALITGASRGIGRAIAVAFAEQGANLVLNASRPSEDMDASVEAVKAAGAECIVSIGSVDQADAARAMVDAAVTTFGRLDILINNAGITRDKGFSLGHWGSGSTITRRKTTTLHCRFHQCHAKSRDQLRKICISRKRI